jgi:hypothetical protein
MIEWLELWENEQISGEGTPKAFRIVQIQTISICCCCGVHLSIFFPSRGQHFYVVAIKISQRICFRTKCNTAH